MTIHTFSHVVEAASAQPPNHTLILKIYYPDQLELAPFPIVIIFPDAQMDWEAYEWLALALAEKGLAGVICDGATAVSSIMPTILKELALLQESGAVAGVLDLSAVLLGGHGVGGMLALQHARPDKFPQVKGAFAYAPTADVMPALPNKRPLLLLGGTADAIVTAQQLERTFDEAIPQGHNDKFLVILQGVDHFAFVRPTPQIRAELRALITFFIEGYALGNPRSKIVFRQQLNSGNPLLATRKMK